MPFTIRNRTLNEIARGPQAAWRNLRYDLVPVPGRQPGLAPYLNHAVMR